MRIHITGAAGLLGSHLARRWCDLGADVSGSDDFSAGYRDNVDARVKLAVADCGNLAAMDAAVAGSDLVYHCAAHPHEGLSVFSPVTITRGVFGSTLAVLTACLRKKVKRIVNCSSMARYGAGRIPFDESDECRPVDPYGCAKLAAEREVELLCTVHGMEWATAVPHNIIGPGQKYDDPYRNVVGIFINRCLQGKPPIIYGGGRQKRCFSFVSDVVDCLVKLGVQDNVVGMTVNIGPDEAQNYVTINDLAERVMCLTDYRGAPIHVPDRPCEVKFATCSADRARRLLGYQTHVSLDDGLAEMVSWIRQRGPLPFDYYLPLEIESELTPRTWKERLM